MKIKELISKRETKVLLSLLLFDVIMVVLHLLFGNKIFGNKTIFFNLDWEGNLPTMYQSFKIVFSGAILFCIWLIYKFVIKVKNKKILSFWFGTSILLITMGFDEGAELHESIPQYFRDLLPRFSKWYEEIFRSIDFESSRWIIYVLIVFLPPVTAWLIYVFPTILKRYKKRLLPLIWGVIIFFTGAFVLEFVGTIDDVWRSHWYETIMFAEEFLEMVGGSLFVYFGLKELFFLLDNLEVKARNRVKGEV